ncbi:cell division protein ZipA [Marinimicrobium sp. ABcell2]|uniref:cell division protein ZipA n=1 Tax=Marinimicrobium sp. ABcell2 TaxID=3069751 RepID=UPI0027B50227|nr:cell division protein ZipA [Marinimicrobium sp. ABcell2]MDQ2077839.1 cell division protein ZipA [Marinimicrobium sp. ABcell2]
MGVWLTGIIILLIAGILLDGWRRMRQARRDSLKMPRSVYKAKPAAQTDEYPSELPNGGARVVGYRRAETEERTEPKIGAEADLDLDDEAPAPRRAPAHSRPTYEPEPEPEFSSAELEAQYEAEQEDQYESSYEPEYESAPEPEQESPRIPQQVTLNLDESVPMLMESVDEDETPAEPIVAQPAAPKKPAPRTEAPAKPANKAPKAPRMNDPDPDADVIEPEEVLIINVMSPTGTYFQGEALQEAIFDNGLRYGSMNIFHRYRDARGGGPVQFSLANMVKPGTFDLDAMESFQTPGVSLFMTLPLEGDSVAAFDLMLDTAKTLAETLGGELKDENRSVMTRQTMEHDRQRVLEFVRRQLSRVPG